MNESKFDTPLLRDYLNSNIEHITHAMAKGVEDLTAAKQRGVNGENIYRALALADRCQDKKGTGIEIGFGEDKISLDYSVRNGCFTISRINYNMLSPDQKLTSHEEALIRHIVQYEMQ